MDTDFWGDKDSDINKLVKERLTVEVSSDLKPERTEGENHVAIFRRAMQARSKKGKVAIQGVWALGHIWFTF